MTAHNLEGNFYPGSTKDKTLVKIYKTSSGDYYKVQGKSFPIETPSMLEDGYLMSQAQNQFFRECLRKPVYCDMSNGGVGKTYIFCEVTKTLVIAAAVLTISNSSYSLQYGLYEVFANEMPTSDISLSGIQASHIWTNSGPFDGRRISTNPTYSVNTVGIQYIYAKMFITKSSSRRITNRYNVCSNKSVTCSVDIGLTPNNSVNQENNPLSSKHSISFPITDFSFDRGMYLVGCTGNTYIDEENDFRKEVGSITNSPIYLNCSLTTIYFETGSVGNSSSIISVSFTNINTINNTQQVLGFSFFVPQISALQQFSSSQARPSRSANPINQLGGWAAYYFSGAGVSVSFSDTSPGIILYSPEPAPPIN